MATIANNAVRVTDFLILMRLPSFFPAVQSNAAGLRPSTRRQTFPETNLQTFYSFRTSSRHLRLLATLAFRDDKYRPQIYSLQHTKSAIDQALKFRASNGTAALSNSVKGSVAHTDVRMSSNLNGRSSKFGSLQAPATIRVPSSVQTVPTKNPSGNQATTRSHPVTFRNNPNGKRPATKKLKFL